MYITKFGHSCMLIEEGGAGILIDPGEYSALQNDVQGVDAILITHEHQDHLSVESLREILQNNPDAKIMTNNGAGKILAEQGLEYQEMRDGDAVTVNGVLIEVFGKDHAVIHSSVPVIPNTGFFIANRFFYPGDAFVYPHIPEQPRAELARDATHATRPVAGFANVSYRTRDDPLVHAQIGLPKPVEILALPVTAPWMRSAEAVDYAIEIRPKICIPVHDAILKNPQMGHRLATQVLEPLGIEVRVLEAGERGEF